MKQPPEKIYLQEPTKVRTERLYDNDVEYARTDIFLEKAAEWLKKNADDYTWYDETEGESGLMDGFVDDFKKYMKGE